MKRLFTFGVAICFALGTFAVANAAKKKAHPTKQSLSIPAKQTLKTVSKRTVRTKQELQPIPEAPDAPIFQPPLPTHEVQLPPSPQPYVPPPVAGPLSRPVVGVPQIIEPNYNPVLEAPAVELFKRVKYVGLRKKAPNAVSKLIVIKNPLRGHKKRIDCCQDECVAIEICVPPCKCEIVREKKNGNKIRYNYGEFGVEVRIKKDHVVVAYHRR